MSLMMNQCLIEATNFHYEICGIAKQQMPKICKFERGSIHVILPFPLYENEQFRIGQLMYLWGQFFSDITASQICCDCYGHMKSEKNDESMQKKAT